MTPPFSGGRRSIRICGIRARNLYNPHMEVRL